MAFPVVRPPELRGPRVTVRRAPFLALATLFAALIASVLAAGPAKADLYRYWSVWQADNGSWSFIETAPDSLVPDDGDVLGWRYAVGGVDASTMRPPRTLPPFADICGTEAPPAGEKNIALVIDPGTAADAPAGQTPPSPSLTCATVPTGATAVQALQAVAETRVEGGLVCAILGYPGTGCGDTVAGAAEIPTDTAADLQAEFAVADPAGTAGESAAGAETTTTATDPAEQTTSSPSGLLVLAGLAAVLAVAAVGYTKWRQNGSAPGGPSAKPGNGENS